MKVFLNDLRLFFEKLDSWRDKALFVVIKPFWPRQITPNHLTIARIMIGIYLFVLLFYYKDTNPLLVVSLFCIGAITDMLDGSIARGLGKETKLGIILDPVADRVLIIPIAVYSLFNLHAWLLASLIGLEIINALVSAYAHGKKIFSKSNIFGKVKMFLQSVVFLAILFFWPHQPNEFFLYLLWLSAYLIILSIIFKIIEIKTALAQKPNL